jgi:hypothetical protein
MGFWLRPLSPVCFNLHHMFHFFLKNFSLASPLTYME